MTGHRLEDGASHSAPASPRAGTRSPYLPSAKSNGHVLERNGRHANVQYQRSRTFHPEASLVLVGVRGSGKRSLGLIAATALGRRFITEDSFFSHCTGLTRQDYLKVHGSEEFHKQDVEITRRMLEENPTGCVIDCGLGSLTSSLQDYLRQYCTQHPVIYLIRDMEHIRSLLNLGDRSARLLEAGDPSHRKCSNFEYYNLEEPSTSNTIEDEAADRASPIYSFKLRKAQEDFSHFVRIVTGASERGNLDSFFSVEVSIEKRAFTHALQLPLSVYERNQIDLEDLQGSCDVVQVVIDQWNHTSAKAVTRLIALIRRFVKVPILYSVSLTEIQIDSLVTILNHGLRAGVEYLSMNLDVDAVALKSILATKGRTKIIGSYAPARRPLLGWRDSQLKTIVDKAVSLRCDAVRIILPDAIPSDLVALNWFKEEVSSSSSSPIPVIAYNSGNRGRNSQVLNKMLTTVTHEALTEVSSEVPTNGTSVLTSKAAMTALFDSFTLDRLGFCIVGGNVTQSLSPPMHNAAYAFLGLKHNYSTKNIRTWTDIENLARNEHFGGASIVQPWKVKIVEKVTSLGDHGKAIGAVNTIVPLRAGLDGKVQSLEEQAFNRNISGPVLAWHAENTDWLGIRECISRSLSPRNVIQPKTTGLVVGAGGMARAAVYALLQLGCRNVFMHNRTIANARAVATHFNSWLAARSEAPQSAKIDVVKVIDLIDHMWPEGYQMPTVVVSCVRHEMLDGDPGSDFQMPGGWLGSPSGGVVVEMAYMTKETALTRQMLRFRESTNRPWVLVNGIETLIEQAMGQFEIMTGRKAPRKIMTEAIQLALRNSHQYVADGEVYNT